MFQAIFLAMAIGQPWPSLSDVYDSGEPFVLFVGTKARAVKGVASAHEREYHKVNGGVVRWGVFVVRANGYGDWLPVDASDSQIRIAAGIEVGRVAVPFVLPTAERRPAGGSVPSHLTFLADLVPYTSARMTQLTLRRWSGVITSSSRSILDPKWLFPGGLAGVKGWTSELRKSRNATARVFLKRQDPDDGNSAVTWDRAYPDGSVFADVLRNADGKVFEVRVSEKRDGAWEHFVAFRDRSQRTTGYVPVSSRRCVECHRLAGVSEYSAGAVPGGDMVISDPMPPVEEQWNVQGGYGTRLN